jgi:peroxiredoxin Q/BCP
MALSSKKTAKSAKKTVKTVKKASKKASTKNGKKSSIAASKKSIKNSIEKTASAKERSAAESPSVIREGTRISDRPVLVAEGRVPLSSLAGEKGMVLYFYPKDATPGCTQEACDFRDAKTALQGLGFSVVGVSPDSPDSHEKFVKKQSLNFPLISDTDHSLCREFGVWAEKKLYGRSFMGVVRSTFILDRSLRVQKVFSPVRVAGHADEVKEAIRNLA